MTIEEITKRIYNIFGNGCLSEDAHKCEYDGNCKEHELNMTIELMKEYAEQIRTDAIEEFRERLFNRLCRLTLSMQHFELFDDALQETVKELKEQSNE